MALRKYFKENNQSSETYFLANINTTPLVDVMLVLLIIFIITIPVVINSAPVRPPIAQSQTLPAIKESVTISVNEKGVIYWNQNLINESELIIKLNNLSEQNRQSEIYLSGAGKSPYKNIAEVVKIINKAGFSRVVFITKAEDS